MRDIALTTILLIIVPLILYRPHVGVLAWAWVAFMNPHKEVYTFLQGANLNFGIAVLTVLSLTFSRDKSFRINPILVVILTFAAWTTLTTYTAVNPELSNEVWSRNLKTFALVITIGVLINSYTRLHALILVTTVSVGYWGVVNSIPTLVSLGNARIVGPHLSMIADNNNLALALVMTLPLVEYCRHALDNKLVRSISTVAICLIIITIIGTYSRGGLIALVVVAILLWLRVPNRLLMSMLVVVPFIIGLAVFPEKWTERMGSIKATESDQSFQGRVQAWGTAWRIGLDRPILGVGYRGTEDRSIFARYNPTKEVTRGRAVHNAYLQVLADHGFVGLGLFALMLFMALEACVWIKRRCAGILDLEWLRYLASMLQVSFIGYGIGAIALSVAYYDVLLVLVMVSSLMKAYAQRELDLRSENNTHVEDRLTLRRPSFNYSPQG